MDFNRLHTCVLILFAIILFSTLGYWWVEDMPLYDSLYMTIITISTVGFSEIKPLTDLGRGVTMLTILSSITFGGYAASTMVRVLIEGEMKRRFERRRMQRMISRLQDHFIICGYGRIGRIICQELAADEIPFVIIEQDDATVEQLERETYLYIKADATTEEALNTAGILRAKGLVTAVRSDANNMFIALTAKGLHPDIYILSRTSDVKNEEKLRRAGANDVVSPYYLGGSRMAHVLKRPTVVDFIDGATMGNKLGLSFEEAVIRPGSSLVGKNLIESYLRRDFGVIIVGIKRVKEGMIFNPSPNEVLRGGDVLVVIGKREDMVRMADVL